MLHVQTVMLHSQELIISIFTVYGYRLGYYRFVAAIWTTTRSLELRLMLDGFGARRLMKRRSNHPIPVMDSGLLGNERHGKVGQ